MFPRETPSFALRLKSKVHILTAHLKLNAARFWNCANIVRGSRFEVNNVYNQRRPDLTLNARPEYDPKLKVDDSLTRAAGLSAEV